MWKPDSMRIPLLLIAVYLHGLTRESSGEMNVVLTPTNAVVSDRENVTLQCIVSDVNTRSYTIKWSHTPQDSLGPLQSNITLIEETLSRTLESSLTLSRPGPDFITVLYFCEVHYTGRGGNLVSFAQSVISRSTDERKSECVKSDGQGKVIHLFQQGPSVDILCKVSREPTVPELRWNTLQGDKDDKIQLEFGRGDDGTYRYINSSLAWNQLLDGVILFCKATTYRESIVAEPCVIGLIKNVQQHQIIPRNTSLSFGLVNEAKFWCSTIGLNHQSCSYIWACQPNVSGCHGNTDTIIIVVDESSVPEKEIDVNCQVECIPGVSKEAQATLTIHSPLSQSDSRETVMPSTEHAGTKVSLQLHSNSKDDYVLKCTTNFTGNDEPAFTWYIDGKREISNSGEVIPMQSTFHVDHSFNLVVCDVLLNDDIIRVWGNFTESVYTTPDNDIASRNNYTTNDPVFKSSPKTAPTKPVLSDLSASSLLLIVLIGICGLMALVVFAWLTVSTLKRNLNRNPIEASKVKTFRAKRRCPLDDTGVNLTPIAEEKIFDFVDSLGDYAYPSFQIKNLNNVKNDREEYFAFQDASGFSDEIELNESNYEEFPDDNPCSQEQQSHSFVNQSMKTWTPLSSMSSSSPCSSSYLPPTPPLIHEYHTTCDMTTTSHSDFITNHRFIQPDSLSSPHSSHQLFHEYLA